MKKLFALLMTLALLLGLLSVPALAAGESFDLYFTFDKEFYEIGDTVTVQMHLDRTDSDADYTMYYFEGGVLYSPLYLDYIDSSEAANNAIGMRVTPSATYYNMSLNTVGVRYHGLTSPATRSAKLILAELKFTAKAGISAATLYQLESSVSTVANTTAALNAVDGTYTIGNPAAPTFAVGFAAGADKVAGSAPTMDEKAEGDLFVLPACAWTREGHTFAGWGLGKTVYPAGAEFTMPAEAVTFTAQWTKDPVERSITFTAGTLAAGQSVSGAPPAARKLFPGDTLALPTQNTLVLVGHSFEGWNLDDKTYQPGEVYTVPDGNVTFAAVWKSIETGEQTGGGGSVDAEDVPWDNPYIDIPESQWYYESVRIVTEKGLMDGMGGGKFEPLRTMNRAMMVTLLYRAAGRPTVTAVSPFRDVAAGDWYGSAVIWAHAQGLAEGQVKPTDDTPGVFAPTASLTRQEMVTLLWRWAGSPAPTGSADPAATFSDWDSVAGWARSAMRWAVETGLVDGMGDGTIAPTATANRAQCAAVLTRLLP